jgi:O-antigen ligase
VTPATLRRLLLIAAAVNLALLPTGALTFWRSLSFGLGALLALLLVGGAITRRAEPIPSPGYAVLLPVLVWSAWATASLLWSVHPEYSADELKREVGWNLLTMIIFYVAGYDWHAWRVLVRTALGALAVMSALALGFAAVHGSWAKGNWHTGVGAYATYLVIAAPLLLVLLAPPPAGFRDGKGPVAIGLLLLALLLAAARMTDNRMVWVALAASCATAAGLAGFRWRATLAQAPARWLAPLLVLLVALGMLFTDAAREKAKAHFPPDTTVAQTFEHDPRLVLWNHTVARIAERPWTGFGFGKSILENDLRGELHDPLLIHAHNIFIAQWLQTGVVGVAAFTALLMAIGWRYLRFYRAQSDTLALLGLLGLTLLAGFVVKNLTDDFLVRSNAKEFWALNALILGWGTRQERAARGAMGVVSPANS